MADEKNTQNQQVQQQSEASKETPKETPKEPTIAELQAEIKHLKEAISASNSDAAKKKREAEEWKGKYTSTLDEQKKKEFEAEENARKMQEELSVYKTKERVASYTAKLMSAGYDAQTAALMASGLPEGVSDEFFESQKAFLASKTQEIKTQTINSQPNLPSGIPPTAQDAQKAEDEKLRKWFGL